MASAALISAKLKIWLQISCFSACTVADAEALRLGRAEEAIPMSMADRLRRENPVRVWREHRSMTATELAAAAGISNSQLSAIENGESSGSVAALQRIANVLEVTVDDLLS